MGSTRFEEFNGNLFDRLQPLDRFLTDLAEPEHSDRFVARCKDLGPYFVAPVIALCISVVSISNVILRNAQQHPNHNLTVNTVGLLITTQAANFLFCTLWGVGWGIKASRAAARQGDRWSWVRSYEESLRRVVVQGHGLRFITGFLAWGLNSLAYTMRPKTGNGSSNTVLSALFQMSPVSTAAVVLIGASLPGNTHGFTGKEKRHRLATIVLAMAGVGVMFFSTPVSLSFGVALGAGILYGLRPFPQGWLTNRFKVHGAMQMLSYSVAALLLYLAAFVWLVVFYGFGVPDFGGSAWVLLVSGVAAVGQQSLSQYAMGRAKDKSKVAMWQLLATPTTIGLSYLLVSHQWPTVPVAIGAMTCLVAALVFSRINDKDRKR